MQTTYTNPERRFRPINFGTHYSYKELFREDRPPSHRCHHPEARCENRTIGGCYCQTCVVDMDNRTEGMFTKFIQHGFLAKKHEYKPWRYE